MLSHGRKEEIDLTRSKGMSEPRILLKLDLRILPCLMVVFVFGFLDKVNIANAAVFGLPGELGLTGPQFSNCLVIFFVSYTVFQIPAGIGMKKTSPHLWLSGCMFLFGFISMMQGFVHSYGGLLAARFFLGVVEACVFPCCFHVIAMWYKRHEAQKRFTFFYCSATLAGAFGGLLASAIGLMDGLRGYKGWRWIFIVEGAVTCAVAILFYFIIPDFPEDARWLSEEQRIYIQKRLRADQGDNSNDQEVTVRTVVEVLKDSKVVISTILYFCLIVAAYGYALFAPTIISGFGYSPIKTQLYSVPPWSCAWGFALIIAFLSDRIRHRFAFVMIPCAIAVAGFIMLLTIDTRYINARYAALFLVVMGIYTASPVAICWAGMNVQGHARRGVALGCQIGFAQAGGIASSYLFLKSDAPRYTKGYATSLALVVLCMILSCVYFTMCLLDNRSEDGKRQLQQPQQSQLQSESEANSGTREEKKSETPMMHVNASMEESLAWQRDVLGNEDYQHGRRRDGGVGDGGSEHDEDGDGVSFRYML